MNKSEINVREKIKEEYKRCLSDPVYFMRKYVKIQHPLRGTLNFDLYQFQEKSLRDLISFDYNIILKSRQMGITTLTSAYALWLMIFHKDKNILCISIKQETAKEIVTRVRFANNNLPSWLKVKCTEDNRLSLRLENGSQIKAVSSSGDAGRSSALSLLIIDEAAFIDSIEEIWLSAQQTLSTGGKAIILSTPNGVGNFFHKTWIASEAGENKFNTINLPWKLHPERDQAWREEQTKLLGVKGSAQECDCLWGDSTIKILGYSTSIELSISLKEFYYLQELCKIDVSSDVGIHRNRWKVLTPTGYKSFSGIRKLIKNRHYVILLSNEKTIKCSDTHPFISSGKELTADKLKIGDFIDGENLTTVFILSIELIYEDIELYDVLNVDGGNIFYVDGVVSHNCDFSTTGHTVLDVEILKWYKNNTPKEPIEKRWIDKGFWIWEYPDYSKDYLITADVARGDGGDKSAFHILEMETLTQVAEYDGCIDTKTYGNLLVGAATEYNNAILVVENANVGWATLQQIIDLEYPNTFYSSADLQYIDLQRTIGNKINKMERDLKPGFTTTTKTRPLIISKLEGYFREKSVKLNSIRLYEELAVFIWNNGKAEAMSGYNDDLVTSLGMGLWVRDTALRLKGEAASYNKSLISSISKTATESVYSSAATSVGRQYWSMPSVGGSKYNPLSGKEREDLTWLLK